jgi:hypothetical protein
MDNYNEAMEKAGLSGVPAYELAHGETAARQLKAAGGSHKAAVAMYLAQAQAEAKAQSDEAGLLDLAVWRKTALAFHASRPKRPKDSFDLSGTSSVAEAQFREREGGSGKLWAELHSTDRATVASAVKAITGEYPANYAPPAEKPTTARGFVSFRGAEASASDGVSDAAVLQMLACAGVRTETVSTERELRLHHLLVHLESRELRRKCGLPVPDLDPEDEETMRAFLSGAR